MCGYTADPEDGCTCLLVCAAGRNQSFIYLFIYLGYWYTVPSASLHGLQTTPNVWSV